MDRQVDGLAYLPNLEDSHLQANPIDLESGANQEALAELGARGVMIYHDGAGLEGPPAGLQVPRMRRASEALRDSWTVLSSPLPGSVQHRSA
jgi:hypothetical protein